MKRIVSAFAIVVFVVFGVAGVAHATGVSVKGACSTGWYVNPDESNLMPTAGQTGFDFNGPSLVHHETDASYKLTNVPTDGDFSGVLQHGVKPLFKMETTNPYSTLNKTADGKWWSSKLTTGSGSQSSPVDSPADLVGKGSYTDATVAYSFGVGYANDSGSAMLVKSITFHKHTYDLTCVSPSPSASATPSTVVTSTNGVPSITSPPAAASLPKTGASVYFTIAVAGAMLLVGSVLAYVGRRRRRT